LFYYNKQVYGLSQAGRDCQKILVGVFTLIEYFSKITASMLLLNQIRLNIMMGGLIMAEIVDLELRYTVKVDYIGDVKEGKPNGKGKAVFRNGGMYEGDWVNGKQEGYGKEYYPDGTLRYEGEYLNGLRHGEGTVYYKDGSKGHSGKWKHNEPI
jgi:hypothetical protein